MLLFVCYHSNSTGTILFRLLKRDNVWWLKLFCAKGQLHTYLLYYLQSHTNHIMKAIRYSRQYCNIIMLQFEVTTPLNCNIIDNQVQPLIPYCSTLLCFYRCFFVVCTVRFVFLYLHLTHDPRFIELSSQSGSCFVTGPVFLCSSLD